MNKGHFKKGHKGYWTGKTMSLETKNKMSAASIGHPNYLPVGFVPWNKGKKTTPEVIEKLRTSHLGQKAWNKLNRTPEEFREVKRVYRKKNPLQFKAYDHKKRLQRRDLTQATIQLIYESNIKQYQRLTCYLCLIPIEFGNDHLEHKTPVSRGGSNEYDNLAVACGKCNRKKHTKTEQEYKQIAGIR